MNVQELIERLQEFDGQAEVRMANQPNWPLAHHVWGAVSTEELAGETECEEHGHYSCDECVENATPVVWLVEGDHPDDSPYAPGAAWDMV